jgi:hypothetical protein
MLSRLCFATRNQHLGNVPHEGIFVGAARRQGIHRGPTFAPRLTDVLPKHNLVVFASALHPW